MALKTAAEIEQMRPAGTSAALSTASASSIVRGASHAAIASSISCVRGTRPSFRASAGSSARSSRSIAFINRLKIGSLLPPITMLPSQHA